VVESSRVVVALVVVGLVAAIVVMKFVEFVAGQN
jgi:type II secretory pathway pseudopilin PulG